MGGRRVNVKTLGGKVIFEPWEVGAYSLDIAV